MRGSHALRGVPVLVCDRKTRSPLSTHEAKCKTNTPPHPRFLSSSFSLNMRRHLTRATMLALNATRGACCDGKDTNTHTHTHLSPEQMNAIASRIVHKRPPSGSGVDELLTFNKEWSDAVSRQDPTFFPTLAKQQTPQYLWIGCSDSRVPANQIVGLAPGEVFVHRNVANVVARSDLNCLSVIQFAVEHLKVEHIIVCGHYNCGGVMAAYHDKRLGLVDNWIRHVADVKRRHTADLAKIPAAQHIPAMCELNVINQVSNVVDCHFMQDYWRREGVQGVQVHGWCYGLDDGIIKPLLTVQRNDVLQAKIDEAVAGVAARYGGGKQ